LEVGKWYIFNTVDDNRKQVLFITKIKVNEVYFYGVDEYGNWRNSDWYSKSHNWIEATEQEVFEALKNEAVKRGFKEGTYMESINNGFGISRLSSKQSKFINNMLSIGGCCVFNNGTWATIIETITKEEAEKLLNKKIL